MSNNAANLVMEKALDAMWQRGRVILENVANATTPGYKRKVVAFEDSLDAALRSFDERDTLREKIELLDGLQPEILTDSLSTINVDGNNVDSDQEFTELTRTAEQYQYVERLLNDSYARLRYAITEGRG